MPLLARARMETAAVTARWADGAPELFAGRLKVLTKYGALVNAVRYGSTERWKLRKLTARRRGTVDATILRAMETGFLSAELNDDGTVKRFMSVRTSHHKDREDPTKNVLQSRQSRLWHGAVPVRRTLSQPKGGLSHVRGHAVGPSVRLRRHAERDIGQRVDGVATRRSVGADEAYSTATCGFCKSRMVSILPQVNSGKISH